MGSSPEDQQRRARAREDRVAVQRITGRTWDEIAKAEQTSIACVKRVYEIAIRRRRRLLMKEIKDAA